jgi:hypothetical protein
MSNYTRPPESLLLLALLGVKVIHRKSLHGMRYRNPVLLVDLEEARALVARLGLEGFVLPDPEPMEMQLPTKYIDADEFESALTEAGVK